MRYPDERCARARWTRESVRKAFARVVSGVLLMAFLVLSWNCETMSSSMASIADGFGELFEAATPRERWSRRWGPLVPHESFPGDCGVCHVPESWNELVEDFKFDHEQETGFSLLGAHAEAACLRCHNDRGPVAVYVERGCGGCHADVHQGTLGLACESCHQQMSWYPTGLIAEHASTRLPLFGAHATTPCESCHERAPAGEFRNTPADCHFCHQRDAIGAFPNHVVNNWIRNCDRCHTQAAWSTPGFDHSIFPLLGGHAGRNCNDCHVGGRFTPLPPQCVRCHLNDYLAAPNHVAGGFSVECQDCHVIDAWR